MCLLQKAQNILDSCPSCSFGYASFGLFRNLGSKVVYFHIYQSSKCISSYTKCSIRESHYKVHAAPCWRCLAPTCVMVIALFPPSLPSYGMHSRIELSIVPAIPLLASRSNSKPICSYNLCYLFVTVRSCLLSLQRFVTSGKGALQMQLLLLLLRESTNNSFSN